MTSFADSLWHGLRKGGGDPDQPEEPFDPATLGELPEPARRFLTTAVPPRTPLSRVVTLEMTGEIKLGGRWLPFTARQILRAGVGFVWAPTVGGRVIRFTGADALGPDGARIDFRFHGRIPVVRSSGPDIQRSASGRLAAETVAWLPQALTPQAGARWEAVDDTRATVIVDAAGTEVPVEIAVDEQGQIQGLGLKRWKDSAKPPGYAPFGGSVDSTYDHPEGVRIARSGTVGWDWQTPAQSKGEFFRYLITSADFGETL